MCECTCVCVCELCVCGGMHICVSVGVCGGWVGVRCFFPLKAMLSVPLLNSQGSAIHNYNC